MFFQAIPKNTKHQTVVQECKPPSHLAGNPRLQWAYVTTAFDSVFESFNTIKLASIDL